MTTDVTTTTELAHGTPPLTGGPLTGTGATVTGTTTGTDTATGTGTTTGAPPAVKLWYDMSCSLG